MIQRKQTLFLLGSTIISVLLLYLPLFEMLPETIGNSVEQFTIPQNSLLLLLNGTIGIFSFISIFLFKNRNIQIRLSKLALLLTCIMIFLIFFLADGMTSGKNLKIHYVYGSYLPVIQILIIFLAAFFIKQDEKLVRSADRLR